jgi:hypothetical protein
MSDLEREFELEMEDVEQPSREAADDLEREFELEMEDVEQPSREAADATAVDDLAQRFFELSQRQFESESEVDSAVNGLLNEVERQFFYKRWKKKLMGKLAKFGGKFVKGLPAFQGIKAVTQLARGDLKGSLGALAKSGLASAIPGGSAVLPALKSLGVFEPTEDSESDIDSWRNYVQVAKEAYEQLANNLNEKSVKNPVAASQQATQAFQSAVSKHTMIPNAGMRYPRRKAYTFRVRRGDDFTIHIKGY